MSRYVIDSWAWVEYLEGSELGSKAKIKIESGNAFTSIVTVAEVTSKVARMGGDIDMAFNLMTSLSRVIVGNDEFAKKVGLLHSTIKKTRANFGLADAFVLYTARSLNAKVLTGDPDFDGLKEAEILKGD